ncbi:MAG TPA: hypothetical protein VLC08_03365 [Chitinolyticbacter sp.]|nr:hypothetical protein [Chitinolyticbacter sp.]
MPRTNKDDRPNPNRSYSTRVNALRPVPTIGWLIITSSLMVAAAGVIRLADSTAGEPWWWWLLLAMGWPTLFVIGLVVHQIAAVGSRGFTKAVDLVIAPVGMTLGRYASIPWPDVLRCHYVPPAPSAHAPAKIELHVVHLGRFTLMAPLPPFGECNLEELHQELLRLSQYDNDAGLALYHGYHFNAALASRRRRWGTALAALIGLGWHAAMLPGENALVGTMVALVLWLPCEAAYSWWQSTRAKYRAFYLDDGRLRCTQDRDTPIEILQLKMIQPLMAGKAYTTIQTDQGWLCGEDESWQALTLTLWEAIPPWCETDPRAPYPIPRPD